MSSADIAAPITSGLICLNHPLASASTDAKNRDERHGDDGGEDLSEIVARERIRDCLVRLARGEDRRDAALISGCFWSDAAVEFGIFAGVFDDYLAWVTPSAPSIPRRDDQWRPQRAFFR